MEYPKVKIVLSYILVILWMIVIFIFSNANGELSGNSSEGLISNTITIIDNTLVKLHIKDNKITNEDKLILINKLHMPVRKLAHFTEYLILCLLWINALNNSKVKHKYLYAIILSILYACSDEYHQTFIADRSGQVFDVFIDSMGVITGSLIHTIIGSIKK